MDTKTQKQGATKWSAWGMMEFLLATGAIWAALELPDRVSKVRLFWFPMAFAYAMAFISMMVFAQKSWTQPASASRYRRHLWSYYATVLVIWMPVMFFLADHGKSRAVAFVLFWITCRAGVTVSRYIHSYKEFFKT